MIEGETDPRVPLQDAVGTWRSRVRTLPFSLGEPTLLLPVMRVDARWLQRLLELLIGHAASECSDRGGVVRADVELGRGFVAHRISWQAANVPARRHPMITAFDLPLANAIATRLGGELRFDDGSGEDGERSVTAVFPVEG
jgi:hypothetical protein